MKENFLANDENDNGITEIEEIEDGENLEETEDIENTINEISERLANATGKTFQDIWNCYVYIRLAELEEVEGIDKTKLEEIEKEALISNEEIPYNSFTYIWKKCLLKYPFLLKNIEIIEAVICLIPFCLMLFNKVRNLNKGIEKIAKQ